jgi:hypothetical protein
MKVWKITFMLVKKATSEEDQLMLLLAPLDELLKSSAEPLSNASIPPTLQLRTNKRVCPFSFAFQFEAAGPGRSRSQDERSHPGYWHVDAFVKGWPASRQEHCVASSSPRCKREEQLTFPELGSM